MKRGCQKPRIDVYIPGDTSRAEQFIEFLAAYGEKLYPWQELVFKRWNTEDEEGKLANQTCLLDVPRQNGKDISEFVKLPTLDGWRELREIKVGDTIFGDDGKPTKVLAKYEPEEKNFYEIDFGNAGRFINETIKCGGGHLWAVQTTDWDGKEKVVDTKWIFENLPRLQSHKQTIRVRLTQPVEYPERKLPLDPYCLGLWLGDGCSCNGQLACHEEDFFMYKTAYEKAGFEVHELKQKSAHGRLIGVLRLTAVLREMGLIKNKHIPPEYLVASIDQRYELLRGLMDSDGYAERHSSEVSWCQPGRPELVEQFMELVCSLGMKPSYRKKELSKKNPAHQDAVEVKFNVVGNRPVFKSKRRLEQFEKHYTKPQSFNYWYIKDIRKIEKGDDRYYCLAVDNESHLFLCGKSYIPTHNTRLIVDQIIVDLIFNNVSGLYTAQKQNTVDETRNRVLDFFYNGPEEIFNLLTDRFRNKPKNFSFIELELPSGAKSRYDFMTRTRLGGLGRTFDKNIHDEAADMYDAHLETLQPTISAAPGQNPQTIFCGTPPMVETVGEVFARTRGQLLSGAKGALTEWGVEFITDKFDRDAWYKTNPSLGYTLLEKAVEAEAASMSDDGFNRMRLGWWAGVENKRAIPQNIWDKCYTETPDYDEEYKPVYAVKFSPDRTSYSLAGALPLKNGKIHVEIIKHRPMNEGTSRLVKWLIEPPKGSNSPRWVGAQKIILDGVTGAAVLYEELVRSGVPKKKLVQPNMKEIIAAHEFIWEAIKTGQFSHYRQPILDQTVRITKQRQMGRYGGFGWESMSKDMSTSALDAATFAYWGMKVFGKKGSAVVAEENQNKWRDILSNL